MKAYGVSTRSDAVRLVNTTTQLSSWQHTSDPSMIDRAKIYPGNIVVGLNKSASPTVAASGGTPAAVDITPSTGFSAMLPIWCKVTLGSLATGETVTVTVTATYDDGTTASVSDTLSASGTIDVSGLVADGKVITKLSVTAQSNKTTTSATCTVVVIGFQH